MQRKLLFAFLLTLTSAVAAQAQSTQAQVARGKYIVEKVTLCGDCHTPMTDKGEPDMAHWLQGAMLNFQPIRPVPEWSNATPAIAGLPGWTDADAVKFLQTGVTRTGKPARPPMPAYRLNKEDAEAVVAYLKSLKRKP